MHNYKLGDRVTFIGEPSPVYVVIAVMASKLTVQREASMDTPKTVSKQAVMPLVVLP